MKKLSKLVNKVTHKVNNQLQDIFDSVDHPNIASINDKIDPLTNSKNFQFLVDLHQFPINEQETIQIIRGILGAIICLKPSIIIYPPCKFTKQNVIKKQGQWGLCNISLDQNFPQQVIKQKERKGMQQDYQNSLQQENLVHSLGVLWLEMLTCKKIGHQQKFQPLFLKNIKNTSIKYLIQKILSTNLKQRISVFQIIKHQPFKHQQFKNLLFSSLPKQKQPNKKFFKRQISLIQDSDLLNPYEEALMMRDLNEVLTIIKFMSHTKRKIKSKFKLKDHSERIQFSCYLIDLKILSLLQGIEAAKKIYNLRLTLLDSHAQYRKFIEKKLQIEESIEVKKKLQKFKTIRIQYAQLFREGNNIDEYRIEELYQKYLADYLQFLKRKNSQKQKIQTNCLITQILILINIDEVFKWGRTYIFSDFIKEDQFDIEEIINKIDQCKQLTLFKNLQNKIAQLFLDDKD